MLQKQSPFLDDMNKLIQLAQEIGLIHRSYYNHLPNATKCKTMRDAYKSHAEQNHTVIVDANDIYGMLVLFGIGVCMALIAFMTEQIILVSYNPSSINE